MKFKGIFMSEIKTTPFKQFSGSFPDRLNPLYFLNTTDVFERIVSRTHEHFWDPNDSAYIDFDAPFDLKNQAIMPFDTVPELCSPVAELLTPDQQVAFANDSVHWWLSGFLHGEQGALSLALSLCDTLQSPSAVEYAANQAREEARHVAAFTNYISSRWGEPLPVNPVFGKLLFDIVSANKVHRKIIGMLVLVEGLAMGFMANLYAKSNDPLLKRLAQLVMTDEAFHHKAGKLWAEYDLCNLDVDDRNDAEDWALECFQALMFNVFNPSQKAHLYAKYGLKVEYVRDIMRSTYTEEVRRREMSDISSVFRVLLRTLVNSQIVTDRTIDFYNKWVNIESLSIDEENPIENVITAEGLAFLQAVNDKKKHIHRPA
jgi:hypothetical protein